MRENRTSGSMRGRRKRATSRRACALLYLVHPLVFHALPQKCSEPFQFSFTSSHRQQLARVAPQLPPRFGELAAHVLVLKISNRQFLR